MARKCVRRRGSLYCDIIHERRSLVAPVAESLLDFSTRFGSPGIRYKASSDGMCDHLSVKPINEIKVLSDTAASASNNKGLTCIIVSNPSF